MLNRIFSQSIEVVTTVNRYKPVLVIALLVVLLLLSTATVFAGPGLTSGSCTHC